MRHLMLGQILYDPSMAGPSEGEGGHVNAGAAGDGDGGLPNAAAPAPVAGAQDIGPNEGESPEDLSGVDVEASAGADDVETADDGAEPVADSGDDGEESDIDRWVKSVIGGPAQQPQNAPAAAAQGQQATQGQPDAKAQGQAQGAQADDGVPNNLKPFLSDDFAKRFVEEFPDTDAEKVVGAVRSVAQFAAAQNRELVSTRQQVDQRLAAFREAPIHAMIDSIPDLDASFGNYSDGQMTPDQYMKRVALDKLATGIRAAAKGEGRNLTRAQAMAIAAQRMTRKAPATQKTAERAAMVRARAVSAQRTPASLRGGVNPKPSSKTTPKDTWNRRISSALA